MSNEFLSRWSRLKRAAAAKPRQPSDSQPKDSTSPVREADAAPLIELSSLPAIESINAQSNVAVFLQAGVPEDLTRAALRNAWATDPAIRDFVGVADNQWDFNAEGTITGFGSLSAEECARYLAAWTLRVTAAMTPTDGKADPIGPGSAAGGNASTDEPTVASGSAPPSHTQPIPRAPVGGSLSRAEPPAFGVRSIAPRPDRTHGSALPK